MGHGIAVGWMNGYTRTYHEDRSTELTLPDAQVRHSVAPVLIMYLPVAQRVHVDGHGGRDTLENLPIAQAEHSPAELRYWPGKHNTVGEGVGERVGEGVGHRVGEDVYALWQVCAASCKGGADDLLDASGENHHSHARLITQRQQHRLPQVSHVVAVPGSRHM